MGVSAPVEAAKSPSKMSFWAEESAAKVMAIRDPGAEAWAAARRLVSQQPDSDSLAAMIFGSLA